METSWRPSVVVVVVEGNNGVCRRSARNNARPPRTRSTTEGWSGADDLPVYLLRYDSVCYEIHISSPPSTTAAPMANHRRGVSRKHARAFSHENRARFLFSFWKTRAQKYFLCALTQPRSAAFIHTGGHYYTVDAGGGTHSLSRTHAHFYLTAL